MKNPGCFGVPSVFSFAAKTCTGCAAFAACKGETRRALARLNLGVITVALLEQHQRYDEVECHAPTEVSREAHIASSVLGGKRPLSEREQRIHDTLPVKVQKQYVRLVTAGFVPMMKHAVTALTNPFERDGYRYLHVAFAALLDGGFTKKGLRQRYMDELGWSENTAFSHVSQIWHLLPAVEIASERGGRLVVSPTLRTQTEI